jgi:lysophospholipase L1-like esterase
MSPLPPSRGAQRAYPPFDGVHLNAAGYEILDSKTREQLLVLMK